jgi:hypothetical protein
MPAVMWCSTLVKRCVLCRLAASRIRSRPLIAASGFCAPVTDGPGGFPDVSGLPSPCPRPLGLRWLIGTTPLSDFPETCTTVVRGGPSTARPERTTPPGISGISRFSCLKVLNVRRVSDPAGMRSASRHRLIAHRLPQHPQRRLPAYTFGAQYPRPLIPLLTLRMATCDAIRITRGRCGSLHLQRTALASAPSSRFIPAHGCLLPSRLNIR